MPDRDKRPDKRATGSQTPKRTEDRVDPHEHPDLGEQANPDSQQNTTARPRGHTRIRTGRCSQPLAASYPRAGAARG